MAKTIEQQQLRRLYTGSNLWIGNTQPPTELEVNYTEGEIHVSVHEDGYDPYSEDGKEPLSKETFFLPDATKVTPELLGDYALRGAESYELRNNITRTVHG